MIDAVSDHLERHLGAIVGDWARTPDGDDLAFRVVHFEPVRGRAVEVYCTLGISDYPLGPEGLRVELMMITPMSLSEGAIPPILVHVGEMPIEADEIPRLGDVFAGVEALADISPMTSLYVGRPVYQPPDFALFELAGPHEREDPVTVAVLWLIPIYDREAAFVDDEGWEAFEQLMWDLDVDPTDLGRQPWL